jgi:hypothetical protein
VRLLVLAARDQQVGVGGGQPELPQVARVELLGRGSATQRGLEDQRGGRQLPEVLAGPGLDQAELDDLLGRRSVGEGLGDQAQGDVRR